MPPNAPEFSIIIPTYRRRDNLARCLQAIEQLEFDRDRFEVLVVDDGSPTPPTDVVNEIDSRVQTKLLCARHGGPARARNVGARLARGRFLVFTDDDCLPRRDWLQSIERWTTAYPGGVAIGGHVVNVLSSNIYATASQGIIDYLYEYYGDYPAPTRFFATNNLVLPRAEFADIGGFDEGFSRAGAEDRDLCERWLESGNDLEYAVDMVVRHAHVLGFGGFTRQHFVYGRGAVDLHRSRAERGGGAVKLESARFYVGLVLHPMRRYGTWRGVLLALLHAWSQAAYAAGYFFERARRGWTMEAVRRSSRRDSRDQKDESAGADSITVV
jgi:glycosyltransferase involved in cell wall biosynthesis